MLCEKCKKNEAKINLVKMVNGEKYEIWLCENCARDISDIPFLNSIGKETEIQFQGILTGLLSNIGKVPTAEKEIVCNNCGLTYEDFKKNGKLGCSNCYRVFSKALEPIIRSMQKGPKHIGKIPKINGKELAQRRTLKELKEELQRLIVSEEYESAAIVRDKIKELELSIMDSNLVEKELNIREEKCNGKLDI